MKNTDINDVIKDSLHETINDSKSTSVQLNYVIDHVTKKKVLATAKEQIKQDLELLLLNIYKYPANLIEINAAINSQNLFDLTAQVDILIKNEENLPLIVFKIIEPNDETLKSQEIFTDIFIANPNIKYAVLYDGNNLRAFTWKNKIIEIVDIPTYNLINKNSKVLLKVDLVPADKKLKQIFKNIHNYLYANSNIRIASRIGEELVKLILCKIEDEYLEENACRFFIEIDSTNYEELSANLEFLWSKVQDKLPSYDNEKLALDESSLAYVVKQFQKYTFTGTNSDILGESFQIFIDQSRLQDLGAFFTEIQAVKLALKMLEVSIENQDNFIDPFQGTGGFIQEFASVVKEQVYAQNINNPEVYIEEYLSGNLAGIDIEEELIKISEAKMMTLGGIKYNSCNENSLERTENWSLETQKVVLKNSFSKIGTNPPFGTKIPVKSQDILQQYDLSRKWSRKKVDNEYVWEISSEKQKRNPRVPDILGLERVVQLLKTPRYDEKGTLIEHGGMAAIVLPRQIFSGPKEAYVREWIMRNTIVHAIIDLPTETFQPHTGTKTSILLFTKRATENPSWYKNENHKIFMSIPQKIGHDRRGLPEYKKDGYGIFVENENGDYVIDSDIQDVLKSWEAFKNGEAPEKVFDNSFVIGVNDIDLEEIRLDASYYNPHSSDIMNYLSKLNDNNEQWEVKPLGELVKDVYFPGRFKRNYVDKENGIPFLSGTNISQYIPVGVKYLSKKSKNLEQCLIEKGWILITRSGTTGIVSLAPDEWHGLAVSDHVIRVVPDETKMSSGYIYTYLRSAIGQAILKKGIYGSVVDEITPEFIKSIPVAFPKNEEKCYEIGNLVSNAVNYRSKSVALLNKAELEIMNLFSDSNN